MAKLIINADDFGHSRDINEAIIKLLLTGRIQRTTLMVSMPHAHEAYEMAKKNGLLDKVGLHINLTDGEPLSESIRHTRFCQNGVLNHEQVENGTRLRVSKEEAKDVKEEVQAQFDKFKEIFGYYPKHVDGHRHIHNYLPFLFIIMRISKACGVESMRIPINLYASKKARFAKKAYKWLIINLVRRHFKSTDYMGAWFEYVDYFKDSDDKTVEIMVHPTIHDNKIVDIIYDHDKQVYYDFDNISK